jgi:hypothetical protein
MARKKRLTVEQRKRLRDELVELQRDLRVLIARLQQGEGGTARPAG